MPTFTAQSPAWLPSQQQRLTRAIDGATPSSPEPTALSKAPRRTTSKQAAFLNFVLVCQKPTPATAKAKDVPAKTAKPRGVGDGVGRKASPWSLPPSSLNRLSDPVLDGSTASPRWDGWSFKRQGRAAEATAKGAARKVPPLDAKGAGEHASGDTDGADAAASEHEGLESLDAANADADVKADGTDDEGEEEEEEEDEDMFVMEADAAVDVGMGRRRSSSSTASSSITSASELAAICEYSMVRAASHLTQLGLHRIKFPGAVFD